jgi:hypothetical protein
MAAVGAAFWFIEPGGTDGEWGMGKRWEDEVSLGRRKKTGDDDPILNTSPNPARMRKTRIRERKSEKTSRGKAFLRLIDLLMLLGVMGKINAGRALPSISRFPPCDFEPFTCRFSVDLPWLQTDWQENQKPDKNREGIGRGNPG